MRIDTNTASGQERRLLKFTAIMGLLLLISCTPKNEEAVIPPGTFPLSKPYIGYGVINVSYAQVFFSQDIASAAYLRMGSVVSVLERKQENIDGKTDPWVLIEGESKGWIKESMVDIYDNKSQAENASQHLKAKTVN